MELVWIVSAADSTAGAPMVGGVAGGAKEEFAPLGAVAVLVSVSAGAAIPGTLDTSGTSTDGGSARTLLLEWV